MAFLKWQVLRLWLKTCQGVEQYWWNLAVMSMNDHRCHFIHLIVMVMSISLIIHAWWHNDKNHKRLKNQILVDIFRLRLLRWCVMTKSFTWQKLGSWQCRDCLQIKYSLLTPCHFYVNLHQMEVILGVYMFLRSRNSFLTSVFKFDEVLIKYSWIIGHDPPENTRDGGKTVIQLLNQVRLT